MTSAFLRHRSKLFWTLQIGGWLLVIPVFLGLILSAFKDPSAMITLAVSRQIAGFLFTLALWRIYRRWTVKHFDVTRDFWKVLLACVVVTALDTAVFNLAVDFLPIDQLPEVFLRGALFLRFSLYLCWSAFYFIIKLELDHHETEIRLARSEAANREAELQFLRAQINPHFLFNALTSIIGEAENPSKVVETTHSISTYLRYSLSQRNHFAPLGDELDAIKNYLSIEERHHDEGRFQWSVDASPSARALYAPTALVQPLVENAIKYGLRTSPPPLRVRVSAEAEGDSLVLVVENSGTWFDHAADVQGPVSTGIGMVNVRRRLSLLCGDQARLDVETPEGYVRMRVNVSKSGRFSTPIPIRAFEPITPRD